MTPRHTILGMGLLALAAALPALGQQGPGGGPRHGDFGGLGGFDGPPPFEQRQGMRDADLKDALGMSDEQWKALQPKVTRVQELQRDVAVGHGMGMGMGGGPGMPPGFAMGAPGDQAGGGRHGGGGGPQGGRHGPTSRPAGGHGPTSRPAKAGGPPGGAAFGAPDGHGHDHADHHGPGGGGFGAHRDVKPSKVMERFLDLQEALDDKNAKSEDLKAKIEAFHQARDEARGELTKAEAELRGAVTPMQEATLITMGVLD